MIMVTGSLGLVGSEAVRFFLSRGEEVVGVDNNMRKVFFGKDGDVAWNQIEHPRYRFYDLDIRDARRIMKKYHPDVIIHAAAQPSHDWAATNPILDFGINAKGTLELLEGVRNICPKAVFIYVSTNKVYGDLPNEIILRDAGKRWTPISPRWFNGIDETMSIDQSTHSLFGCSKLYGDVITQEYGRYFGLKTGVFRCGCITGSSHSAAEQHGFLAYMAKCKRENRVYTVYGYEGKQVRDNIHAYDLVNAFHHFASEPRPGEVYNMGGGVHSNISVLEALDKFKMTYQYVVTPRKGDHKWYVSDVSKFCRHYPEWEYTYTMEAIIENLISAEPR